MDYKDLFENMGYYELLYFSILNIVSFLINFIWVFIFNISIVCIGGIESCC